MKPRTDWLTPLAILLLAVALCFAATREHHVVVKAFPIMVTRDPLQR